MTDHLDRVRLLLEGGGSTMPALLGTAFVLWTSIGHRWWALRRGDTRPPRQLVHAFCQKLPTRTFGVIDEATRRGALLRAQWGPQVPTRVLDEALLDLEERLVEGAMLVRCLVSVSPLLGLLGTVTGLIETFGALGQSASSTASEGIAGGIVEALYATQVGLAIAVPGLLMGGFLHHRERNLAHDLDALRSILCARSGAAS